MRGTEYGPTLSDWADELTGTPKPDKDLSHENLSAIAEHRQSKDNDPPVLQGNIFDGTASSGSIPFARELQGDPLDEVEVIAKVSRIERRFGQNKFGH